MKRKLPVNLEKFRQPHPMYIDAEPGSIEGFFMIPYTNKTLAVISGLGGGWGHVSVSLRHRCPTWDEMCFIKNLFFEKDELVIQFHPPENDYVNCCKYCLHLWQPLNQKIELPPREFLTL